MKQEEIELLIKDLCARLPYELYGLHRNKIEKLQLIDSFGSYQIESYSAWFNLDSVEFKPYLRLMSNMTGKEMYEYEKLVGNHSDITEYIYVDRYDSVQDCLYEYVDWLHEHHFDYRGLIEKGLALEAPENMYKFE